MRFMRPDRGIVKKAIADSGGNMSRAAALLGCTRQTLYTWVYQLGLERFAGIRLDTETRLDTRHRKDTQPEKTIKTGVYSAGRGGSNLHVVTAQAPVEMPLAATVKLTDALWRRAKIRAIVKGVTVSEYVKGLLEADLAAVEAEREARPKRGEGKGGSE